MTRPKRRRMHDQLPTVAFFKNFLPKCRPVNRCLCKVSRSYTALAGEDEADHPGTDRKARALGQEKDEAERRFHKAHSEAERLAALERENFELFGLQEPEPDLPPHLSAPINLAKVTQQMVEDAEWTNGSAKDRRKD